MTCFAPHELFYFETNCELRLMYSVGN